MVKNDEVMKDIEITDSDVVSKEDTHSNLTVVNSDELFRSVISKTH